VHLVTRLKLGTYTFRDDLVGQAKSAHKRGHDVSSPYNCS